MRKEILICDHCKKEVDWLYVWPHFQIDGKAIRINQMGYGQYCKVCSQILLMEINAFKENENEKNKRTDY